MRLTKKYVEFSKEEFESLIGDIAGQRSWICPDCGILHPSWKWAQDKNTCITCKDRPTIEDTRKQKRT